MKGIADFQLPIADLKKASQLALPFNWQLAIDNWQSPTGFLPSVFYRPIRLRARVAYAAAVRARRLEFR